MVQAVRQTHRITNLVKGNDVSGYYLNPFPLLPQSQLFLLESNTIFSKNPGVDPHPNPVIYFGVCRRSGIAGCAVLQRCGIADCLFVQSLHAVQCSRWCCIAGGMTVQAVQRCRLSGNTGCLALQAVRLCKWCIVPGSEVMQLVNKGPDSVKLEFFFRNPLQCLSHNVSKTF